MPLATPLPSCDYEWTSTATQTWEECKHQRLNLFRNKGLGHTTRQCTKTSRGNWREQGAFRMDSGGGKWWVPVVAPRPAASMQRGVCPTVLLHLGFPLVREAQWAPGAAVSCVCMEKRVYMVQADAYFSTAWIALQEKNYVWELSYEESS